MVAYLVTGVNRGIGLALVDQLSQDTSNVVIGTVRNLKNAQSVLDLKRTNLHLIEVDFGLDQETITTAFKPIEIFAPNGLDTVIHNAGVLGASAVVPLDVYKAEDYLYPFVINVVGAIKFYKAVSPYLYRGVGPKAVGFISSIVAQIESKMKLHGYGASKAALNYFMRQVYEDNESSENPVKKNSVVVSIHPGVVETDMLKAVAGDDRRGFPSISPEASAEGIIKVLSEAKSGLFVSYDGTTLEF